MVVKEDELVEPGPDATEYEILEHDECVEHNELAKCYIMASLDPTLQKKHEGKKNCKEILERLKVLYEERNRTARQNAMSSLKSTKKAEGTPVQAYIHKMIGYINELESLGVELDNESKVDAILVSLSRSFKQFKVNFSIQEINLTLSELSNMLQRVEGIMKKDKSIVIVTETAIPSNYKKRKFSYKKKRAKGKKVFKKESFQTGDESFFCNKKGHWKRNCKSYIVSLKKDKSSEGHVMELKDYLYVPSFRRNLIFVSKLRKNGYSTLFGEASTIKRSNCGQGFITLEEELSSSIGELSDPVGETPNTVGDSIDSVGVSSDKVNGYSLTKFVVDAPIIIRRSSRIIHPPVRYRHFAEIYWMENKDDDEDPRTYKKAMSDIYSSKWVDATKAEMNSMYHNNVWALVDPPIAVKPIGCMMVLVKLWLSNNFSMKHLGQASYILGLKLYKDREKRRIGLSLSTYVDKIIRRFSMQDSKNGILPIRHRISLSKEMCPKSIEKIKSFRNISYASTIDSLMYAMLCTRPDITYDVGLVSRFQSNPSEEH
ncbi:uncharacterized protein LOC109841932 [Asparagus officinalis]|uniref:uncharacterized protein LOC109841932 n=1 Tax=Asparagus officinalis TaxID=4686 RepID=UPI00098E5529|nr:uncharacterized protein LOC109841932 [Asparagus officinalis]